MAIGEKYVRGYKKNGNMSEMIREAYNAGCRGAKAIRTWVEQHHEGISPSEPLIYQAVKKYVAALANSPSIAGTCAARTSHDSSGERLPKVDSPLNRVAKLAKELGGLRQLKEHIATLEALINQLS